MLSFAVSCPSCGSWLSLWARWAPLFLLKDSHPFDPAASIYNAVLKRTSGTYLVILGGAIFFQAGIDPIVDGFIYKRNIGVSVGLSAPAPLFPTPPRVPLAQPSSIAGAQQFRDSLVMTNTVRTWEAGRRRRGGCALALKRATGSTSIKLRPPLPAESTPESPYRRTPKTALPALPLAPEDGSTS